LETDGYAGLADRRKGKPSAQRIPLATIEKVLGLYKENNIKFLEDHGIRFIAVTQGLDTDIQNPASRFLLHVLGAAAEFERSLIRERTQAGRLRYQQDFDTGRVGKTVYSRSRKNLPIGRPKRIFNRERAIELRPQRG
jgi:DNA invertase Pin-like site-specific DNA recombinase